MLGTRNVRAYWRHNASHTQSDRGVRPATARGHVRRGAAAVRPRAGVRAVTGAAIAKVGGGLARAHDRATPRGTTTVIGHAARGLPAVVDFARAGVLAVEHVAGAIAAIAVAARVVRRELRRAAAPCGVCVCVCVCARASVCDLSTTPASASSRGGRCPWRHMQAHRSALNGRI